MLVSTNTVFAAKTTKEKKVGQQGSCSGLRLRNCGKKSVELLAWPPKNSQSDFPAGFEMWRYGRLGEQLWSDFSANKCMTGVCYIMLCSYVVCYSRGFGYPTCISKNVPNIWKTLKDDVGRIHSPVWNQSHHEVYLHLHEHEIGFACKSRTCFLIDFVGMLQSALDGLIVKSQPPKVNLQLRFLEYQGNPWRVRYEYIPAPSKGCQINPKGWLIDTP